MWPNLRMLSMPETLTHNDLASWYKHALVNWLPRHVNDFRDEFYASMSAI